jgi:hypothetical protein
LIDHEDVTFETIQNVSDVDDDNVSKMETVTGRGTYPIRGSCLDPKPDRGLLVGRVKLDVAALHSDEYCEPVDSSGKRIDFQFKPIMTLVSPDSEPFVGEIAKVDAKPVKSATTIIVRLKKYASLGQGRTIEVKVADPTSVVIGNLAYITEYKCDPKLAGPVPFDHHFEMFYLLAGEEPWRYDRPVPFACCNPNKHLPVWFTSLLDLKTLNNLRLAEDVPFAIGARIVCPMASFQSPQ